MVQKSEKKTFANLKSVIIMSPIAEEILKVAEYPANTLDKAGHKFVIPKLTAFYFQWWFSELIDHSIVFNDLSNQPIFVTRSP